MSPQRRFYFDLQVHTSRFSPCSSISPEALLEHARARGLDGLALTEHSAGWSLAELENLRSRCGGPDLVLLPGYEIRTRAGGHPTGDLLVFGLAARPAEPCSIDELCRAVRRQGGIVIAPHPFAPSQGIGEEAYSALLDALEVHNFRYADPAQTRRAEEACRQLGLAAVASSDAHALEEIGRCCTVFDAPIHTVPDLVEAIRARRCCPRPKPPPPRWWRRLTRR